MGGNLPAPESPASERGFRFWAFPAFLPLAALANGRAIFLGHMHHTAALIEQRRQSMRQAITNNDMELAGFYARMVVLMQDFPVKLRPVASILAEQAAADQRRKIRKPNARSV